MLKHSFLFLILSFTYLNALTVVYATKQIAYEQKIENSYLGVKKVNSLNKNCEPLTLENIKNNEFIATHFINVGSILCKKDVTISTEKSVTFNFGAIEIETPGKIIFENEEYIKIKKLDGSIEKIYKDGRLK